jgi:hypothetical protein
MKEEVAHALLEDKRFRTALAILRPTANEVQSTSVLDLRATAHGRLNHFFSAAFLCRAAATQSKFTFARTWLLRSIENARQAHTSRHNKLREEAHFDMATVCFLSALQGEGPSSSTAELLAESASHLRLAPNHFPETAAAIEVFAHLVSAETPSASALLDLMRIVGRNGARIASWFLTELKQFTPEWSETLSQADLDLAKQFLEVSQDYWTRSGLEALQRELLSSLYKKTEQLVAQGGFSDAMNIIDPVLNYYQRESHGR